MKKKPFDAKTAKKIINEYAEKINILSRENECLKKRLQDSNTSLQINKQILFQHFNSKKSVNQETKIIINDLKKENERLSNNVKILFEENAELTKRIYIAQDKLNDKSAKNYEQIEGKNSEIFLLENKLKLKENEVALLKKKLDTFYKSNGSKCREIYVGDPDKFNTELNTELLASRCLIRKYMYLVQENRSLERSLKEQITALQDQVTSLSMNASMINGTSNHNCPQINNIMNNIFLKDLDNDIEDDLLSYDSLDKNDEVNSDIEIKNNQKSLKRNKSHINIKTMPKLNLNKIMSGYDTKVDVKIVNDEDANNDNGKNMKQIKILKNTIKKYKERFVKLRQKIKNLLQKNNVLNETLNMYIKNNVKNNVNCNMKDISMNQNINELSVYSAVSDYITKGSALENINQLNEINKKIKINKLINDPLDNIELKDFNNN